MLEAKIDKENIRSADSKSPLLSATPWPAQAAAPADFYAEWCRPVFAYFARRTADAATAEDLTADTFERLVGSLQTLRADANDESAIRAWVYRTASNVYKNSLRGASRRLVRENAWSAGWRPTSESRTEIETSLAIGQAMARLQPEDRDVLGLKYWEGLTAAEIAGVLVCEPREVYTAIERCLRALKRQLEVEDMISADASIRRPEERTEAHSVNA